MIIVLHGKDINASYNRLSQIILKYSDSQKIRLSKENNTADFLLNIASQNLLNLQKIIICENFISDRKIKPENLKEIPVDITVILWENTDLPKSILDRIRNLVKIENFKPKAEVFWFLDSFFGQGKKSLSILNNLDLSKNHNLTWQIANRIFLLILAKLGLEQEKIAKITGKRFETWQWEKIVKQANFFSLEKLYTIYRSILKVDFMIKTGATDLNERTLIPLLILKYLQT